MLALAVTSAEAQFRVKPYLLPGDSEGHHRLTWITEQNTPGTLYLYQGADTLVYHSSY